MKKLILLSFMIFLFLSACNQDLKKRGINYTIIDTTGISRNGFGITFGYDLIIKIDTSYYSAFVDSDNKISEINRKLKNIKNLK